jgi:hypothetical protein
VIQNTLQKNHQKLCFFHAPQIQVAFICNFLQNMKLPLKNTSKKHDFWWYLGFLEKSIFDFFEGFER